MSDQKNKNESLRSNLASNEGEKTVILPNKQAEEDAIMQANFSSLLYVITEQQALIGKLLEVLLTNSLISAKQLETITDVYGNAEVLDPVYADIYKRFAHYFLATKEVLEQMGPYVGEVVEAPDENLPGGSKV